MNHYIKAQEIKDLKSRVVNLDTRLNRDEISAIEGVRELELIVYQIIKYLEKK